MCTYYSTKMIKDKKMKYPQTRYVFDRKKEATKDKPALIQIEVLFEKKKRYIGTGVKVCKGQWDASRLVHSRLDMKQLNDRIKGLKANLDDWINILIANRIPFEWERLEQYLEMSERIEQRFIDFVKETILTRKDIRETTRKTHRKLITALEEFGKIIYFSDITRAKVMAFDDYLRARDIKQTTIHSYHKLLKTYINEAIRRELVDKSPYTGLRMKRGESESGRFLTEDEIEKFKVVNLPSLSLRKVRDLFLLQCLTGLSYSDLMSFDFNDVEERGGQHVLSECRNKTGVAFTVVLLPEAIDIIKRYDFKLPKLSNQQYNMRLKIVAAAAGLDKPIASHWGRRTCGMYLLNRGFSIEVVAKVLGHKSIRTTEAVYAKILDRSVEESFKRLTK